MAMQTPEISDLFIIGGGINGCGIARDAAGRGLSVTLAEMNDLASATSSASTKLFHGGLRYLEYFEFRLVREALIEREVLLRNMPHISWPMRFVLPLYSGMRFDGETPTSKLLSFVAPWLKGRRPVWLIRLGLFLYDHLGGRKILPATRVLSLADSQEGAPLQPQYEKAFEYSDCWVDDARLVALNARDAAARGAKIITRREVISARRSGGIWHVETRDRVTNAISIHHARLLINAAGPWVGELINHRVQHTAPGNVRLVRGSHIIIPKRYDHTKCYFFPGTDGRIIFAIPYEDDFTLIGTTDADHPSPDVTPEISAAERRYLCDFASQYFKTPVTEADVLHSYSGVRPLYDDGASSASAATRDYTLKLDIRDGAALLNVFGGKITTYRRLAENALDKIAMQIDHVGGKWTADAPLPGGNFPVDGVTDQIENLRTNYPFLTERWAKRLIRSYGTDAPEILGTARSAADLGIAFGATLTEAEIRWLMEKEFAQRAEDVIWRRSKCGLRMADQEVTALDKWMLANPIETVPIGI